MFFFLWCTFPPLRPSSTVHARVWKGKHCRSRWCSSQTTSSKYLTGELVVLLQKKLKYIYISVVIISLWRHHLKLTSLYFSVWVLLQVLKHMYCYILSKGEPVTCDCLQFVLIYFTYSFILLSDIICLLCGYCKKKKKKMHTVTFNAIPSIVADCM